ncbi:MAG: tripartite tricarboxylate transporter substrate-binding protein, partial [Sulfuricaulis sp.]|nr:tripartite tricarboxylate transporter substrate-binding protein [Sulfuricaulis sp.]
MQPIRCVFVLFMLAASGIATAQPYPVKTIKLIVPIPPGGGSPDMVARLFSLKVAPELGQPIVVENRTGSNGNIAAQVVAQSAPDGYTVLVAPDTLMTANPYLYAKTSFDTQKDFAPIATISANRFILSVTPSLPIKTFPDFIEYAKKANPPLAYGSGGNGSQHHLTMEMLKARAGINLLHVPYKGGTPAAIATAGGETAAAFSGTSVIPLLNTGRLRPIAVAGKTRSAFFPDLPAIAEFYPGFDATSWQGLFVPTGTAEAIIVRLRDETNKFLALADTREKYKS